jgi:hypothetical protein
MAATPWGRRPRPTGVSRKLKADLGTDLTPSDMRA